MPEHSQINVLHACLNIAREEQTSQSLQHLSEMHMPLQSHGLWLPQSLLAQQAIAVARRAKRTCWQWEQTLAAMVGEPAAGRFARRSAAAAALHGLQ